MLQGPQADLARLGEFQQALIRSPSRFRQRMGTNKSKKNCCWRELVPAAIYRKGELTDAQYAAGEGLASQCILGDEQSDEADHGKAAIQLLSTLMEAPATLGTHHFHAGLAGKRIEAAAFLGGHSGAADGGAIKGTRSRWDVLVHWESLRG